MTTKTISISSITIPRDERQRRDLGDLSTLMASLKRVGQINPITVTPEHVLIAGERRLTAATTIGWDSIRATIRDEEPTEAQRLLELEENIERAELPWKDHCLAVHDLHQILSSQNSDWSMGKTAKYSGQSTSEISRRLMVAEAILTGDEFVCAADRYSVAVNFLARKKEREEADEKDILADMLGGTHTNSSREIHEPTIGVLDPDLGEGVPGTNPVRNNNDSLAGETQTPINLDVLSTLGEIPLQHTDFNEWANTYSGPSFNFLHCDFPYGINVEKHHGAGSSFEGYDDSKDVYFELLDTLERFTFDHVSASAHLMFWYAFRYHNETVERLEGMGWKVQERPLIWHRSDNSGVLPDPKRGPRWIYETCLMATRGDRPIVQPVANCVAHPNEKEVHKSEKPVKMLYHFFRMFVDPSTRMLDPTAGSGNAVYAAEMMGARSYLGLERDESFYETACKHYAKRRALISASET